MNRSQDFEIKTKTKSSRYGYGWAMNYTREPSLTESERRKLRVFNENLEEALAALPENKRPKIYPATLPERIAVIPLFCTPELVHLIGNNRALRGILPHALKSDASLVHRINAAHQAASRCQATVRPKGKQIAERFGLHADM